MTYNFFKKIIYSSCNEDSNSERNALNISSKDVVLCITASWARPLDLLIDSPKKVISIDFNKTQNFLLELKVSAYKKCDYENFLSFLWIANMSWENRKKLYKYSLRDELSFEAQIFWDSKISHLEQGIIYIWTWDKILGLFSRLLFFRRKMILQLFQSNTIEQQQAIWNNKWDTWIWKAFLILCSRKFIWKYIFQEPGVKYIPNNFKIYPYMHKCFKALGSNFLLRANPFAYLLFYWKYNINILPPHLMRENFHKIRDNIHTLDIQTCSLEEIVSQNEIMSKVDCLSLSDFGSYSDNIDYESIWNHISMNCKSWARFCERQFLVKRNPETLNTRIIRNNKLEKELAASDVTSFYTFVSGFIS